MSLPHGWTIRPLLEVVVARSGNSKLIKGKQSSTPGNGLVQAFSASGPDVWVTDAEHEGPGVVISAVGARCGKTFLANGRWTAVANTHVLKPSEALDAKYLWYLTNDERFWLKSGTAQPFVKVKDTLARPQLLPPLDEQRRIVDLLEDHLSRLDAADALVRSARERLLSLRLGSLRRWRLESLDSCVDGPKPLGEVAETSLGKMLDAKKSTGMSTRYLRNINVRWGRIDTSDVFTVPLSDQERAKFSLREGDLLVCEGGEPGRAAIWEGDEPMTFQKALHRVRVRPGAGVQVPFLQLMLEEFVRTGRATDMFTGTTIKHLPQEKLRQIEIPVPPIPIQDRVLAEARSVDAESARLESELLRVARRSEALRRSLLDAAFSGALVRPTSDREGARV